MKKKISIFEEQISRKPDRYPWTQNFIESIQNSHWTVREFSFQSDLQDFKVKLSEPEKEMLTKALATISQIEIGVKKFWGSLGNNLPHPSINDMGYIFGANEVVHGDAYERLLEVLGLEKAFDEILELDIIKGRVNYLRKHLHKYHEDNRRQFIYSIVLFALFVENIALFSQFYTIAWFGRFKNQLKDTNKQVDYTSKEEALHFLAGAKIINTIRKEHPELFDKELEDKVLHEAELAVKYECKIIEWILGDFTHKNLNPDILKEFIKNRLNDSLAEIGYKRIFDIDKDLIKDTVWFDETVLGNSHQDFISSKPVEYSKSSQSFSEESLF